jgi:hypothetical protein
MTQISKSTFNTLYVDSSGTFLDNSTGQISEGDMRQFADDISDSASWYDDVRNTDTTYFEQQDFIFSTDTAPWDVQASGASAAISSVAYGVDSTEKAFGVIQLSTGSDTTGRCSIARGPSQIFFGNHGSALVLRYRVALSALSDGTDTYTAYIGFGDGGGAGGDNNDGAYFRYTHSVNSGEFEAVTAKGGARTATDTNVAAATTYKILEIRVNAAGNSVTFYIDGALVATNTTNIPDTISNLCGFLVKIEKSAGTTARILYIDWFDFNLSRTTAR